MLDAILSCKLYDEACFSSIMFVDLVYKEEKCNDIVTRYNSDLKHFKLIAAAREIKQLVNECEVDSKTHLKNIISNYISPLGVYSSVIYSCSKLDKLDLKKLSPVLEVMNVDQELCDLKKNSFEKNVTSSSIEIHRGYMSEEKFAFVVKGVLQASFESKSNTNIVINDQYVNVIPYMKGSNPSSFILTLGGAPLLNNKKIGLKQIFSLNVSWSLKIIEESLINPNIKIISNINDVLPVIKKNVHSDQIVITETMNTEHATDILKSLSNEETLFDENNEPVLFNEFIIIMDHISAGFFNSYAKVKSSPLSSLKTTTIPINITSNNKLLSSMQNKSFDFTNSELKDMPGFKQIIPSQLAQIFSIFLQLNQGKQISISDFSHFLVGYQSFFIISEGKTNKNCEIPYLAKETDSGDYIVCL